MTSVALLKEHSDVAFKDLCTAIEGVDEALSWAVVPMREGEYLNSNGSILTMVQHVAGSQRMYASAAFRAGELRWRDLADRYEEIGSDWRRSVEDLHEARRYWLESWVDLTDDALENPCTTIRGKELPAWRIIAAMINHDVYHAGQIEVLKVSLQPSSMPPPSTAEDIRQYCRDLPLW